MLKYISQDLLETFTHLPVSMAAGLILVLVCLLAGRSVHRRVPWFLIFLFGVYLEQLSWLVFFNRPAGSRRSLQLQLFDTVGASVKGNSYVLENILLFIPFGLLLPLIFRGKLKLFSCIILAFLVSLFIEMAQYITARGFTQTDDIVTNVAGAAIGYGIFRIVSAGFHMIKKYRPD